MSVIIVLKGLTYCLFNVLSSRVNVFTRVSIYNHVESVFESCLEEIFRDIRRYIFMFGVVVIIVCCRMKTMNNVYSEDYFLVNLKKKHLFSLDQDNSSGV